MVTTQPPPYSGEKAPPPAYTGTQAATAPPATAPPPTGKPQAGGNKAVYWSYWGILFASLLTWIFSVAAAAGESWVTYPDGTDGGSLENECSLVIDDDEDLKKACDMFNAARAFKFLATTVISITLVLIVVAAFMAAPITGKLGLAAGISLVLFSLFELLAFALYAAFMEEVNSWGGASYYNSYTYGYSYGAVWYDVEPGPSFALAVVAWIFGTVGAITTLVLRARATTDQDGPFKTCMSNCNGPNTGTPAMAPPPAVGTV